MMTKLLTRRSPPRPHRGRSAPRRGLGGTCTLLKSEHLPHDLADGQVAFPSIETAGTVLAAVGAADPGGNTKGVPVVRLAVKSGVGRE